MNSPRVVEITRTGHPIREDIEGLRAIAVMAVVLNHIAPSWLPGGFAGVDIFFVISGYLIGKHLLEDIRAGEFSFLRFYGRRARRLFPALVIVLIAVWTTGWILLPDPDFAALGKHIAASAVFSNNILLWTQSGYFDAPSSTKPLLHLWSLGVEEQFYLVVPFLLWIDARGREGSVRWILRISILSLLAMELRPIPSFYLLDTRFWELGTGVILGYVVMHRRDLHAGVLQIGKAALREILLLASILMFAAILVYVQKDQPWGVDGRLASAGLVAVVLVAALGAQAIDLYRTGSGWTRLVAAYDRSRLAIHNVVGFLGMAAVVFSLMKMMPKDWPGPQTALLVLATASIIVVGPNSWISRILSTRPMVLIGGISYPLYLWHWPAIVFSKILGFRDDAVGMFLPILAAFLLALATKKFIEDPVRFGNFWTWKVPAPPLWSVALALALAGVLGAFTLVAGGYPTRFSPGQRSMADWSLKYPDLPWRVNRCYYYTGRLDDYSPECTPLDGPECRDYFCGAIRTRRSYTRG